MRSGDTSPVYSEIANSGARWKDGESEHGLPAIGRGQVAVLSGDPGSGVTRLGLIMLAEHTGRGMVSYLDVRGWLNPLAAWEAGIDPDRLVIARCRDPVRWGRAAAALLDGSSAVFAEMPDGVKDAQIRKLAALARKRRTTLLLRPLGRTRPTGIAHLTLNAYETTWNGAEAGHGRIGRRTTRIRASGKAMRGMTRTIEMEDDGSHTLRLVSGMAAPEAGGASG